MEISKVGSNQKGCQALDTEFEMPRPEYVETARVPDLGYPAVGVGGAKPSLQKVLTATRIREGTLI